MRTVMIATIGILWSLATCKTTTDADLQSNAANTSISDETIFKHSAYRITYYDDSGTAELSSGKEGNLRSVRVLSHESDPVRSPSSLDSYATRDGIYRFYWERCQGNKGSCLLIQLGKKLKKCSLTCRGDGTSFSVSHSCTAGESDCNVQVNR